MKYDTPPTQVDGHAQFHAPVLSADDDQASITSKLLLAREDPNASEATSVSDLGRELNQQVAFLEGDETISPAGRRARLVPEVERVRGKLEKIKATISSLDDRAEFLEKAAQDFDHGEADETLRLVMQGHMADGRDPEKRKALGRRVLAAAARPFAELRRDEGMLLKAAFESRDLGVPFVDEVVIQQAWAMRKGGDQNAAEVEAVRARAATLRSVAGAVELGLAKLAKQYGLGD